MDFVSDVVIFQVKLFIGGFVGVALGPVTLAAAAMDLVFNSEAHGSRFYRVLAWCRRSEELLGLYAALERPPLAPGADDEESDESIA